MLGRRYNLTNKKPIVQEELSEDSIYDILLFAKELGYNNAVLNPMLINQRMRDITLNPVAATEATLTQAMLDPKDNEIALQEFSQSFEIQSQSYKKILEYFAGILSFDLTYECINVSKPEEYKSAGYKKDLKVLEQFIDGFNYKKEFSSVVKELLRNEAAFYCPRVDGDRMVLQEMPASPQYTMITGRGTYGLLYSFSMLWFILPGVDIRMYPPFFRKKYQEFWGDRKPDAYNSSLPPQLRGDSSYIYWQDIDIDTGWCFKFSPEIASRVPVFSGLFLDLIQQPLMRALQKNINMAAASRLIIGQVGTLKDAASKVKDQFAINPDTLGKFLALVKAAVGDSMKVAAAPLEEMKPVNFSSENELYSSYLTTALSTSGGNSNLYSSPLNVKRNVEETRLALNTDENIMYSLYPQFQDFMEYQINKRTKNYKFKIHFQGSNFYNNREQRLDKQMTLMGMGIVLPQQISAALGLSPFEFQRQLDEARMSDWTEKLTPIIPAAQMGADTKATGRPSKKDSDLSESGEQTRADGGNLGKGGKK